VAVSRNGSNVMVSANPGVAPGRNGTEPLDAQREQLLNRELAVRGSEGPGGGSAAASLRTVCYVLASTVSYYVATQIAWSLTFPDSKVSLFFPPQAVLLCVLLLVPTRHWWAYVLGAAGAHFLATRQADWPPLYALTAEAFDAVKCVLAAMGIRILIKSPLKAITLRDAVLFVLIAVVLVPFGTAFWGASFTVSYGFGTHYWIEWRNLGVSNAVTAVVLVPAFLLGAHQLFARRWSVRVRWRWESSSSTEPPQGPTPRRLSCIRRFLCSSGRRSAWASVESACRC
jgi:hypothetical protein